MDELWKHYTKRKKPDTKGHMLYNSIYVKLKSIENRSSRFMVFLGVGLVGSWSGAIATGCRVSSGGHENGPKSTAGRTAQCEKTLYG